MNRALTKDLKGDHCVEVCFNLPLWQSRQVVSCHVPWVNRARVLCIETNAMELQINIQWLMLRSIYSNLDPTKAILIWCSEAVQKYRPIAKKGLLKNYINLWRSETYFFFWIQWVIVSKLALDKLMFTPQIFCDQIMCSVTSCRIFTCNSHLDKLDRLTRHKTKLTPIWTCKYILLLSNKR